MTDAELYTLLSNDAGITALTTRIYNGNLPEQTELPAVTFSLVTNTPYNTLNGDTGTHRALYTVNAWGSTLADSWALIAVIRTAMASHHLSAFVPIHEPQESIYRFAADYSIFN